MAILISKYDKESHLTKGTQFWISYIKARIKNNKNFLCPIVGPTGTGKSYAGVQMMYYLTGRYEPKNICLTARAFMDRLTCGELNKGDVIVWDEAGIDLNAKQWQSLANRIVNYVMQTFRKENLIVFFTVPYFQFLDSDTRKLVHALFETKKINYKTNLSTIKPFIVQINSETGKMYRKYLRIRNNVSNSIVPVKRITVEKPDEAILKIYESQKDEFTQELYREVNATLYKLNKKHEKEAKPLTERQQQYWDLREKGLSLKEISKKCGVNESVISLSLKAARKKKEFMQNV